MASVSFKVIKVTSPSFNGPRYMAHVPCIGFCFVPNEGDEFTRQVLKFNPESIYDKSAIEARMAQIEKDHPGHSATAVTLTSLVDVE